MDEVDFSVAPVDSYQLAGYVEYPIFHTPLAKAGYPLYVTAITLILNPTVNPIKVLAQNPAKVAAMALHLCH